MGVTRRRSILLALLLAAVAIALALGTPQSRWTQPQAADADISSNLPADVTADADLAARLTRAVPDDIVAERLASHARAHSSADRARLAELVAGDDVAAYRAALDLGFELSVAPEVRRTALRKVLELRVDEPLARAELTEIRLALGDASEAVGDLSDAIRAYREALPDMRAVEALDRIVDDPYLLANAFLQARLYERALDALGAASAPSIEAPALRALGRHRQALDAYRRWLDQVPGHLGARFGVAWSHWYLGELEAAEQAFTSLPGADALYGRALIANRRGDVGEAVRLLRASGEPPRLWLATALLEREERWREATDVYLEIAAGDSDYADDAAWRAGLLADRSGDQEARARAMALLPSDSYFALVEGAEPPLPTRDDLPDARPTALATSRWLASHGDEEGARLVLLFALRTAVDEAEMVVLGEALNALGEYRQPQRAATARLASGSAQLRTWRLAYPAAWPQPVALAAKEAGVDRELVWAVMRRESAFYPNAISRSGAQGLMQVMPTTWDWLAELQREPPADPFDVSANLRYGTYYLGWLQDHFDGQLRLAIAGYNRGQGYIGRLFDSDEVRRDFGELIRAIDALETREYLQAVWRSYRIYQGLARLEAEGLPAAPTR